MGDHYSPAYLCLLTEVNSSASVDGGDDINLFLVTSSVDGVLFINTSTEDGVSFVLESFDDSLAGLKIGPIV